jgi:ADP-heptose:LPS heptosyltransferase
MKLSLHLKKKIDFVVGGMLVLVLRPAAAALGLFTRRDHALTPKGTVYFIKMLGGGSLIIAAPAILGIKQRYPGLRFGIITSPGVKPFAEVLGLFDEIHVINDGGLPALVVSAVRCLRRVFRADTIVDLEVYSRLSSVFMLLACARNRISFYTETTFWRVGISSHLLFFNRSSGTFLFYDMLARLFDGKSASVDECRARLKFPAPAPSPRYRIGIGHGCSDLSPERMLQPAHWRAVLTRACARARGQGGPGLGVEFCFFGVGREGALAEEIIRLVKPDLPEATFTNLCGQLTLAETVGQLSGMREVIAIDSAVMHFARTLRVPVESYWGPTDPRTLLRPIPDLRETVHYEPPPCSPCVHLVDRAPCRGNNICIQGLFTREKRDPADLYWLVET